MNQRKWCIILIFELIVGTDKLSSNKKLNFCLLETYYFKEIYLSALFCMTFHYVSINIAFKGVIVFL